MGFVAALPTLLVLAVLAAVAVTAARAAVRLHKKTAGRPPGLLHPARPPTMRRRTAMRLKQAKTLRHPHRPNTNKRTKGTPGGQFHETHDIRCSLCALPCFAAGCMRAARRGFRLRIRRQASHGRKHFRLQRRRSACGRRVNPAGGGRRDADAVRRQPSAAWGSFFRCVRPCGKRRLYLLHHHQHQRAGAGRHTHSPPGTPDGWRLGGCPLRCRLLRNSRSARTDVRPLSVEWYPALTPGTYRLGLQLEDYGRGCLPEDAWVTACFTLTEILSSLRRVRISTDFGGILTVEAKYYYEYIKAVYITEKSTTNPTMCTTLPKKARGIQTAALCCPLTPSGACKRCGTATFVRRCTTRSRSRRPAPTACGNLRTRWPASWKARKNSPRDNAKRLRLEPSP